MEAVEGGSVVAEVDGLVVAEEAGEAAEAGLTGGEDLEEYNLFLTGV